LPPGKIGITPGPAMAAADRIEITIDGKGGHGAHPHAAIDPVLVAGRFRPVGGHSGGSLQGAGRRVAPIHRRSAGTSSSSAAADPA